MNEPKACSACYGTGKSGDNGYLVCSICHGTGTIKGDDKMQEAIQGEDDKILEILHRYLREVREGTCKPDIDYIKEFQRIYLLRGER